jgi:hypothetical protein
MGGPNTVAEQMAKSTAHRVAGEAAAKFSLPLLTEAGGKTGYDNTHSTSTSVVETKEIDSLSHHALEYQATRLRRTSRPCN